MGTVLASAIMAKCDTALLDTAKTRWPDAEKFIYLNDGQRLICLYKPDAYVVIDTYKLVTGTKQRIPDGTATYQNVGSSTLKEGIVLLDMIRNMGTGGTTPGPAIDPTDLQILNASIPNWHGATANAEVQTFAYDERYPDNYFVYPPQPSSSQGYVEIAYSALCGDVVAGAGPVYTVAINLSNRYESALYYYILHRCYAKDAALSPFNAARAMEYWNLFVTEIGRLDLLKKTSSPNAKQPNPSPSIK